MIEVNKYIDHTLLKPTATPKDIKTLCKEANEYQFYAVCVNSGYAFLASNELKDSQCRVAATVGFPLGASSSRSKIEEARKCIEDGADEIDMVINLGLLRGGLVKSVREEISGVKDAIGRRILKVIIETCYLSNEEKAMACKIAVKAGADFVKTSTGFGSGGATIHDVVLMKEAVDDKTKIKASGGIRDLETALQYIDLGVDRIGTSSGIQIINSLKNQIK